MATTNALLQIFESLSWRMLKDKNLFNQDFKTGLVWSISSGHRESGPRAFSDFNRWRALANFSKKKYEEIHLSGGVGILQSWDISLTTTLADSRFVILYIPFLTNCETVELALMEQRWRVCLLLPIMLLIIFHASQLECVKLMLLTASDQRSFRFSSTWESKAERAELDASH